MTFRFTERRGSRGTKAKQPTETRLYVATGTQNSQYVKSAAYSLTPALVANVEGILYRQDIEVENAGHDTWYVTVPYAKNQSENGSLSFSFDGTGGSIHITTSKETVASYGGTPPDYKQMIGVNGEDVAGADIVIPAMKFIVSFRHPLGVVTIPFAKALGRLTGKFNSDTFLTCAPGEILFLGPTGSDGTNAEAEVTYTFVYEENLQNQVVGAITGITKRGHDIAWIKWKDAVDGGKPVKQPEHVYIERVYDSVAMASAFGFGG